MSIMQTIREKGAKVTVVVIAIALLGFILTDYFSGKGRSGFTGGSKTIVFSNAGGIVEIHFFARMLNFSDLIVMPSSS